MTAFTLEPTASIPERVTVDMTTASMGHRSVRSMSMRRICIQLSVESSTPPKVVYGDRPPLLIADLGWSRERAAAVRAQLAPFEAGWDSPEMDAYDAL